MRTIVIADGGINMNGDVEVAKQLASAAKDADCDCFKIQKRTIEECYSEEDLAAPCESPWGATVRDKVVGRELSWDSVAEIERHCRGIGIEFSASCFDLTSLRRLDAQFPDRPWNKVPSCMAVDEEFVLEVARQRRLAVVSTGLLDGYDAIDRVAQILERADCHYVLMHCVALYPASPERLNLRAIPRMIERYLNGDRFPRCRAIGYSGHETGLSTTLSAVALGAEWVERHVTLDRSMYGADQSASVEPQGMRQLVRDIRKHEVSLGNSDKRLLGDEKVPVRRRS